MKYLGWLLCGTALLLVSGARAGTLALDIIPNSGNNGTTGPQSLGWSFQVNVAILVDGLGFFDATDTQNHDVGIYNDGTQALLLSTTVLPTDPKLGTAPWRVHAITPFSLLPGTYDIAAETGSDNFTFGPTSMTVAPQISFIADRFSFGSPTLTYPTGSSGGGLQGYFGPTFTITGAGAVPEPGSLALIGAGLLALAGFARRRR